MTLRRFRLLLVASVALGIAAPAMDIVFPELLPAGFRAVQEAHDANLSNARLLSIGGMATVALVALVAALYGLYLLRPWAPRLAVLATLLALATNVMMGAWAQSGIAIATSYVASYLWGVVLFQAFFPPFKTHFKSRAPEVPHA